MEISFLPRISMFWLLIEIDFFLNLTNEFEDEIDDKKYTMFFFVFETIP